MRVFLSLFLLLPTASVFAASLNMLMLNYDEVEQGAGLQNTRYLINQQFMRIDNGDDAADYILFDVARQTIFSVNHEDRTILKIEKNQWQLPKFDFKVSRSEEQLRDAPEIFNKPVFLHRASADDKVCTQVFYIKDTFMDEMDVLYQYQQILSGQQILSLKNTPQEFRTPCFLLDQVYHSGDYYHMGLPVQISYSRGYSKLLKDFARKDVDSRLFELPEDYREYRAFSD